MIMDFFYGPNPSHKDWVLGLRVILVLSLQTPTGCLRTSGLHLHGLLVGPPLARASLGLLSYIT